MKNTPAPASSMALGCFVFQTAHIVPLNLNRPPEGRSSVRENDKSPETLRLQGFVLWWTI